jgi:hypothetical protein
MYLYDRQYSGLQDYRFSELAEPQTLVPRCYARVLKIPASYQDFEQMVRQWIATCVQSEADPSGYAAHRERKLVTGNATLVDIWQRILRFRVGQDATIKAEYVWGPSRVESIRFTTTALPPPPPKPAPSPRPADPPVRPAPTAPSLPPYVDPFPNINRYCHHEYNNALDAQLALKKMDYFAKIYKDIYDAAANASLSLGRGDSLVINPEKESFLKLLGDEVASSIKGEIYDKIVAGIFDETVASYLGVVDVLLKLAEVYQGIQNVKLVNEQRGSKRDEAWKAKVSFFVDVKAKMLLKKTPGIDPFKLRYWVFEQFWLYDKLRSRVADYYNLERSRCGQEIPQTTIGPRK